MGSTRRARYRLGPAASSSRRGRLHRSSAASVAPALLVLGVIVLVLLGLLMVYSASYERAYARTGDPAFYLKRQALAAGLGLGLMLALSRLDYRRWEALDGLLLVGALGLTLLTFVPGLAPGGRWLRLGPFNLQPTELLKVALIVYLAASLHRRQERLSRFSEGVGPHLVVLGGVALLAVAQPDFGMALLYVAITYALLLLGGARWGHLLGSLLAAAPPLALLMVAAPYRRARLFAFLDPFGDPTGSGYQIIQSLVSLGSGGLWGRGLGGGIEKLGYLPAAYTDFIFSVLGEELGLVGTALVWAGFALLVGAGARVAACAPDRFGALLAAGLTFALGLQAVLNLGVALGTLPVTGLTLPFVSYGGSSLVVSLAMVGMLLAVARGQGA